MEKFGYQCPECGKGTVRQKEFLNYKTKIENCPFTIPRAIIGVCNMCGRKNFDPQEQQRWADLYKKALVSNGRFLNAEEISSIRKDLGLSIEKFAHLIGCTRQSIYNWENKNRKIPQSRMTNLIIRLIRENIYKGKVDVVKFLLEEAAKLNVHIKIREDVVSIVSHPEYKGIPHPNEKYSENYKKQPEMPGFSPKLKS